MQPGGSQAEEQLHALSGPGQGQPGQLLDAAQPVGDGVGMDPQALSRGAWVLSSLLAAVAMILAVRPVLSNTYETTVYLAFAFGANADCTPCDRFASDAARFVSGAVLSVDGGLVLGT